MKNLHVLPTYKPSRLHFDHSGLFVSPKYQLSSTINSIVQGRNIYITSDEEIKDGDYRYSLIQNNFELVSEFSLKVNKEYWKLNSHIYKKIILTTDTDLIANGVEAIDDEFLNWFVNNSSCEEVEVKRNYWTYEIIIPNLEVWKDVPEFEELKQETLEEVVERLYPTDYGVKSKDIINIIRQDTFINGAKWEQERNYSEEEAYKIWKAGQEYWKTSGASITFEELIEQFKKK